MKFRSFGFVVLLAAFAGSALAQTAISGTLKCPKTDETHTVEVGDRPGHVLILEKPSCTWGAPTEIAGLKSTGWTGADTVEIIGANAPARGYSVTTMENGDKAYSRWQGTGTVTKEGTLTGEGTWSYTGGTGKLKGLKGKGTYKVSGATNGTSDVQMEGTYSLPEPGAAAKK